MQRRIKKKLLSLFTGELSAVVLFALLWIIYLKRFEWTEPYLTSLPSLFAFILLEFILLQGSYYWFLKSKQIQRKDNSRLPYHQLKMFAFLKRVNLSLIVTGAAIAIYQLIIFPPELYWFIFLYLFAIIEHINYYHVRLSYQSINEIKNLFKQKQFRSSKLAKELKTFNR